MSLEQERDPAANLGDPDSQEIVGFGPRLMVSDRPDDRGVSGGHFGFHVVQETETFGGRFSRRGETRGFFAEIMVQFPRQSSRANDDVVFRHRILRLFHLNLRALILTSRQTPGNRNHRPANLLFFAKTADFYWTFHIL